MRRSLHVIIPLAIACVIALPAKAQTKKSSQIAWYGTWTQGLAEAKRSGRPILLISAAPHCRNISGMW